MPDIRSAIANGSKVILKNKTKGTEIELEPVLTERQRDLVLAGGLLNSYKRTKSIILGGCLQWQIKFK